jgi:hypothetical protein
VSAELPDDAVAWTAALAPLLRFDLLAFAGLPRVRAADIEALWGPPREVKEATLGRYPALRSTFPRPEPCGGLHVYARGGDVLAVETVAPPPLGAMEGLGQPTAILPHELFADDAYVHEHLYAARGLVLSVTEPFEPESAVPRIVRCRGVRPMASAKEYGPELYRSLDTAVLYRAPSGS